MESMSRPIRCLKFWGKFYHSNDEQQLLSLHPSLPPIGPAMVSVAAGMAKVQRVGDSQQDRRVMVDRCGLNGLFPWVVRQTHLSRGSDLSLTKFRHMNWGEEHSFASYFEANRMVHTWVLILTHMEFGHKNAAKAMGSNPSFCVVNEFSNRQWCWDDSIESKHVKNGSIRLSPEISIT